MNKSNIAKLVLLALTICVLITVSLKTNTTITNLASLNESTTSISNLDLNTSHDEDYNLKLDNKFSLYNPRLGKTFMGFKEKLGFKESQNNYFRVNTFGYLGKYQFAACRVPSLRAWSAKRSVERAVSSGDWTGQSTNIPRARALKTAPGSQQQGSRLAQPPQRSPEVHGACLGATGLSQNSPRKSHKRKLFPRLRRGNPTKKKKRRKNLT